MIQFLVDKIHDAHFMAMMLAAVAVSATAYTLIMPLFAGEGLQKRMKGVAGERERIRKRERERLSKTEKVSLRQTPKQVVSRVVEDFNLGKCLAPEARGETLLLGRFPRAGPLHHVPVLPAGDAYRDFPDRGAVCFRDLASGEVAANQDRNVRR